MKVYQLNDQDVIGLMESLNLEHMEAAQRAGVDPSTSGQRGDPKYAVNDAFRTYNLVVVRWLQSIGADKLSRKWG